MRRECDLFWSSDEDELIVSIQYSVDQLKTQRAHHIVSDAFLPLANINGRSNSERFIFHNFRLYETQVKKIIKVQSMMRAFLAKRNVASKLKSIRQESGKYSNP